MAGWLDRLLGRSNVIPGEAGIQSLVDSALDEPATPAWDPDPRKLPSGKKVLALEPQDAIAAIAFVFRDHLKTGPRHSGTNYEWARVWRRERLVSELCRRALPFTAESGAALLDLHIEIQEREPWPRHKSLVKSIARAAQAGGWLEAVRSRLGRVHALLSESRYAQYAEVRKAMKELEAFVAGTAGQPAAFRIERDAWGEKALAALETMDAGARARLLPVLDYCASAKGSAPSARWLKAGEEIVARFGKEEFAVFARDWLTLLTEPTPKRDDIEGQRRMMVGESNGDVLKGLAWLLALVPDEASASSLADAAVQAFKKIPNFGARSVKAGNACLYTLKSFPGLQGARRLAVLRTTVKLPSQAAAVEKALSDSAARLNLSVAETEELATPDHGFVDGKRILKFAEASAELSIDGMSVSVAWRGAEGKPQKSEPAQVKRFFPEERKAMKRLVADVEKTLAAVRDRLERLPLEEREWPIDTWRQRYFDHPVASGPARKLVWRFRSGSGETAALWAGGRWLDETGADVDVEGTTVAAWHPALVPAESVRRWRALLAAHDVVQPFKQAHREIYLLTDAERNTQTYSNRFAAHVLRQHQFASLCLARGWKYRLQGGFDSHNTPTIELPHWKLAAEYWIEPPGHDAGNLSPAGLYIHVLTDQVRFRPLGGREPVALQEVPPLVFSEIMRDVDLFVGVTSVGNDPNWADGGPNGRYRDYWQGYAFGDLSVAAETRREVLDELLPRLTALRDVARVDGKFLAVKGKRRDYKIHLGSSNILMSPNDQYLCIVPDRSERGDLQLPFEGDAMLALILSKAFMLAQDHKIADPTIVRQIERA